MFKYIFLGLFIALTAVLKAQPGVKIDSIKTSAGNCESSSITVYYSVRDSTGLNFDTASRFYIQYSTDNFASIAYTTTTTERGKLTAVYTDTLSTSLPPNSGTYKLRFSVTTPTYTSQPFFATVTVNPKPDLLGGVVTSYCSDTNYYVCLGGAVQVKALYSHPSPVSLQWYSVSGGFFGCLTPSHSLLSNSANYSGVTTNILTATGLTGSPDVSVLITDQVTGCSIRGYAELFFNTDPIIKTQPVSPGAQCPGGGAQIGIVDSIGTGTPIRRRWQYLNGSTWQNITANVPAGFGYAGDTTATLTITTSLSSPPGNYAYRCLIWSHVSGCDTVASAQAVFQVKGNVITQQPLGDTICVGGSKTISTSATTFGGATTYQWEYSTSGFWGNVSNGTPSGATYSGNTSSTLNVSGLATGTYWFRCKTGGNGCSNLFTDSVRIRVVDDPVVSTPTFTFPSICVGSSSSVSVNVTGGAGNNSYQWQYNNAGTWANVVNGTPAGASYTGATSISMNISGITATGTHQYRVVVTQSKSGCTTTSAVGSFTVSTGPSLSINQFPSVCIGGLSTGSVTVSGGTGTPTYSWEYFNGTLWASVSTNIPAGASYANANSNALTISGIVNPGSYSYRCNVTQSGAGCTVSGAFTFTVAADPFITSQPTDSSICAGGVAGMSVAATGGAPSLNYQWQFNNSGTWVNVVNNTPTGATYSGAVTANMQVSGISTAGQYAYRCLVSSTGNGCDAVVSQQALLTVLADPVFTEQPTVSPSFEQCVGNGVTLNLSATGGTPALSYDWQYKNGASWASVTNNVPTGTVYSGQGSPALLCNAFTAPGIYQYRCLISASGNGCNTVTSNIDTVKIIASPAFQQHPQNTPSACTGATVSLTARLIPGNYTINYNWQVLNKNTNTWQDVVNGYPTGAVYSGNDTLFISGIQDADTFSYRCEATTSNVSCTQALSNEAQVVLVPQPTFYNGSPALPDDVCRGGTGIIKAQAYGGVSNSYQWQYYDGFAWTPAINGIPVGVAYQGNATDSLRILTGALADGSYTYRCVITSAGNGCGQAISDSVILTVTPDPVVLIQPDTLLTVCNQSEISLAAGGNLSTSTYRWQVQFNGSGQWLDVTDNNPLGVVYNGELADTLSIVIGNINPPAFDYRCWISAAGSGCGSAFTSPTRISIVPQAEVATGAAYNFPAYTQVCSGGGLQYKFQFNNANNVSFTYNWQFANDTAFSVYNIDSSALSQYVYPAGTDGYYRCQIIFAEGSGCNTLTSPVARLELFADPQIQLTISDSSLCAGETLFADAQFNGGAGNLTFFIDTASSFINPFWQSSLVALPDFQRTFTSAVNRQFRVVLSASGAGCNPDTSEAVRVRVFAYPDAPQVSYSSDGACIGTQNFEASVSNPNALYGYTWSMVPAEQILVNNDKTKAQISFSNQGTHILNVSSSVNNGECTSVSSYTINVSNSQAPSGLQIVMAQPGNNLFCPQDNYSSYQWGFSNRSTGEEVTITGANSPLYNAGTDFDTTQYAYWLKVCNSDGCCTRIFYNNNGFASGIIGEEVSEFGLWPNPSTGLFKVRAGDLKLDFCAVFAADGRLMTNQMIYHDSDLIIDANSWSSGLYYVHVSGYGGVAKVKKLVLINEK